MGIICHYGNQPLLVFIVLFNSNGDHNVSNEHYSVFNEN